MSKQFQIPETFTKRDSRKNWETKSEVELGNSHVLKFSTSKSFSGTLNTTAMVIRRAPSSTPGISMETYVVYQDYYKVLKAAKVRVTDKSCVAQHVAAVAENFDAVIAAVLVQYEKELAPGAEPVTDLP